METLKYMIADCSNNEQKSYIVSETFDSVCS